MTRTYTAIYTHALPDMVRFTMTLTFILTVNLELTPILSYTDKHMLILIHTDNNTDIY